MNKYMMIKIKRKIFNKAYRVVSYPWYLLKSAIEHQKSEGEFEIDLAIVAIAKNEKPYIREWVCFYKQVGVSRIYLYDNGSEDGMKEEILDFIQQGFVVYTWFPGINCQMAAYNLTLYKYRNKTKFMAFIDIDEYLMPCACNERNLIDTLKGIIKPDFGGCIVNWRMYGSSGLERKPEGILLEKYLYRAKDVGGKGNECVKSIVNPRKVWRYEHPHFPIYLYGYHAVNERGGIVDGPYNQTDELKFLRINHYFTKSKEEWIKRRSVVRATTLTKRTMDEFYAHDNNDIRDEIGLFWADRVKEIL